MNIERHIKNVQARFLHKNSPARTLARELGGNFLLTAATATAAATAIVVSAAEEKNQDNPDTVVVTAAAIAAEATASVTATYQ